MKHIPEITNQKKDANIFLQDTMTAMFDSNPNMNVLFDSNFQIIDCNPAAYLFFGFDSKEDTIENLLAKISKIIPEFQPDGRHSIPLTVRLNRAKSEGAERFETEFHFEDNIKIVEVYFKRIPYGESFAIAGYMTDITETREWEQELAHRDMILYESFEEAQAANQAKTAFLANMSHEIRTPMNSIMGFAELALGYNVMPKIREYLEKITDSTKWLLHIINDVLDITKVESGKMQLEQVAFDLQGILARCRSVISPAANDKNLTLFVQDAPTTKKLVGDPVRLYQVLSNLLSNAVKFTNKGRVSLTSSVVWEHEDSLSIYFEIKDSGIGMDRMQLEHIFHPFTQADSTTTRNFGGTGLGLAIAQSIVELMGGKIEVESEPNKGSAFHFTLRFETIEVGEEVQGYSEANIIEKPRFSGEILVCEDNRMNQYVICEHLARVGLNTVVAENGKVCLEMVKKRIKSKKAPYDLIFMDIFMPVMDGMEAAEKILALRTGTPIIAMTANIMSGDLEKYKKIGMADFVGKPFTTQELWHSLMKFLTPLSLDLLEESEEDQDVGWLKKQLRIKFINENRNKYNEISKAIVLGDFTLAHRLVHSLKSNAGMIEKPHLQSMAARMEEALKERKMPQKEQLWELETELFSVLEELRPLVENQSDRIALKGKDRAEVLELFEKLEPMLENINPECVNMLEDIYEVPGAGELARQIEDYDFEAATKTLKQLMETIKKEVE